MTLPPLQHRLRARKILLFDPVNRELRVYFQQQLNKHLRDESFNRNIIKRKKQYA